MNILKLALTDKLVFVPDPGEPLTPELKSSMFQDTHVLDWF